MRKLLAIFRNPTHDPETFRACYWDTGWEDITEAEYHALWRKDDAV